VATPVQTPSRARSAPDGETPLRGHVVGQGVGGRPRATVGIDLLPVAGELQPRCSCPDWANPCKHAAAVCYLVADTLDADPFLLFLMRGRGRDTLLAGLRTRRAAAGGAATGNGRPGGQTRQGAGGADGPGPKEATSWASDTGVTAREAWARWAAVTAQGAPPVPAIPLPPPKPGRPTVLAVDTAARGRCGTTSVGSGPRRERTRVSVEKLRAVHRATHPAGK
jgi:hypothetical protein